MSLSEKAMLVRLSISQWTGRKYDKTVSEHVAQEYQTDLAAGRYNKVLVAENAIKAIAKIATECRTFHYNNTLPWSDSGDRMLPSANYLPYTQKVQEFKQKFESAAADFIDAYPVLVQDAKARLNGMFNPSDYPSIDKIAGKYGFDVGVMPLPDSADFRVSLLDSEVANIRQQIENRTMQAQNLALQDLWNRLHDAVSHMADKLSDKDSIFRDSLTQNLIDLCELLPRLNVFNDSNLENMRQAIEQRLCGTKPQELRDNPAARKAIAKDAEEILNRMAGYCG